MSVTSSDIVLIPISSQMDSMASYVAEKRELFEFPRDGYGDYSKRGIEKIRTGILGELALLEYIHEYLDGKYGEIPTATRYGVLNNLKFAYKMIIGQSDGGFEFKLGEKLIDVKTYETYKVSINQVFNGLRENGRPLNLLIDKTQNSIADIYIQAFITDTNSVCLSGFSIGLPPINYNFPKPAYACAIPDLLPIKEIISYLNEKK